jgi:putative ABC transport system permease protein
VKWQKPDRKDGSLVQRSFRLCIRALAYARTAAEIGNRKSEIENTVMETLLKDIRYGVRSLLKRPGFTAIAVITLALGIGANTAIFSVVNAVVLRPLPYTQPDRLVMVWETIAGNDRRSGAPGNYLDWQTQNGTFDNFNLTGDGEPERINGATITSNLMTVLGAGAQIGRTFEAEDDQHQDRAIVLLSDGLWKRRFGSERNIIGRTMMIDEVPHTVVGVMSSALRVKGFAIANRLQNRER